MHKITGMIYSQNEARNIPAGKNNRHTRFFGLKLLKSL